ncbi:MAG TPA: C40 family peptidase, partial [Planctomycetota bacterium]|nr:C40 family peptidase [Planctomycetota bacterium]
CKEEYPIGSIFYLFQGKIISILQCNNEEISYITQKETKTIQGKTINNAPSISWDLCSQKNSILTTIQRFLRNNDCGKNEYLWGGTVLPGLDCSGFVQLVYRLQDISIPRDASQQQQFGQAVEKNDLQIGDLVFFSSHKKWATHVGIYMGNGKFVHCSRVGEYSGVKINDLQGNTEYDQYLNNIYFGATRIQP